MKLGDTVKIINGEHLTFRPWVGCVGEIKGLGRTKWPRHHVRFPNGEALIIPESMLKRTSKPQKGRMPL